MTKKTSSNAEAIQTVFVQFEEYKKLHGLSNHEIDLEQYVAITTYWDKTRTQFSVRQMLKMYEAAREKYDYNNADEYL